MSKLKWRRWGNLYEQLVRADRHNACHSLVTPPALSRVIKTGKQNGDSAEIDDGRIPNVQFRAVEVFR